MIIKMERGATEQDLAEVVEEVRRLECEYAVTGHPDYFKMVTATVQIDETERQRLRKIQGVEEVYSLMSELPSLTH